MKEGRDETARKSPSIVGEKMENRLLYHEYTGSNREDGRWRREKRMRKEKTM
jgi:hypothetical protein